MNSTVSELQRVVRILIIITAPMALAYRFSPVAPRLEQACC